jgi:hypothetical protein
MMYLVLFVFFFMKNTSSVKKRSVGCPDGTELVPKLSDTVTAVQVSGRRLSVLTTQEYRSITCRLFLFSVIKFLSCTHHRPPMSLNLIAVTLAVVTASGSIDIKKSDTTFPEKIFGKWSPSETPQAILGECPSFPKQT